MYGKYEDVANNRLVFAQHKHMKIGKQQKPVQMLQNLYHTVFVLSYAKWQQA